MEGKGKDWPGNVQNDHSQRVYCILYRHIKILLQSAFFPSKRLALELHFLNSKKKYSFQWPTRSHVAWASLFTTGETEGWCSKCLDKRIKRQYLCPTVCGKNVLGRFVAAPGLVSRIIQAGNRPFSTRPCNKSPWLLPSDLFLNYPFRATTLGGAMMKT